MTPTVANLKPAISLFLTKVSMPTQRRIRTCAVIAKAVGTITIRAIRAHNGRPDRKCDILAPPCECDGDLVVACCGSHLRRDRANPTDILRRRLSRIFAFPSLRPRAWGGRTPDGRE